MVVEQHQLRQVEHLALVLLLLYFVWYTYRNFVLCGK